MGQVLIRNLDDETVENYRQKARINGISLEQELRNLLESHQTADGPGETVGVSPPAS